MVSAFKALSCLWHQINTMGLQIDFDQVCAFKQSTWDIEFTETVIWGLFGISGRPEIPGPVFDSELIYLGFTVI